MFDLANAAADRLERGEVQPREALRRLAREVVLDAAALCDMRAAVPDRTMTVRNEATKCASAVRHWLLCREDERICYYCDGAGCTQCKDGIVTVGRRA